MKAFKKLMAAALVCVMALTVLTGCSAADKKSAKNMVEALNNAAKEAKVAYTYERTDAMDSQAKSAMDNAQKAKKIEGATLSGDYSIYYAKLTDTWNSASDLKSIATKANDQFKTVIAYDANTKKADVGICVDKVEKDNYIIIVVKTNAKPAK